MSAKKYRLGPSRDAESGPPGRVPSLLPHLNGFDSPAFDGEDFLEEDWRRVPLWWEFLLEGSRSGAPRKGKPLNCDKEFMDYDGAFEFFCDSVFEGERFTEEGFLPGRFSCYYDDTNEGAATSSSRKCSKELASPSDNPSNPDLLLIPSHQPLSKTDSLLEAVLAAKKATDWNGLKRTESLDSAASIGSVVSSLGADCNCEDCFLGLSDNNSNVPTFRSGKLKKKNSNWRKVRNVVQWSPFIQTYKRHKYPWVQLAGHQGNFKAGSKQGTIMKKLCQAEEVAFEEMQKDLLKPFVPEYLGIVDGSDGEKYLQLQDLLGDFASACVMDIKMGVRTYLEEELAKARHKPKLRKDMYDKMIQIDSNAPTEAEHRAKAVTKPRYMVWRETISSTATLGFRIEGIRRGDGTSSKDFKTTRTREQVTTAIAGFVDGYPNAIVNYVNRLKEIRAVLEKSKFFKNHELIGSSLLFVHNEEKSGVWLIDFAKTVPLPDTVKISHKEPWVEGTHEDGYLIGLDNLIDLMESLQTNPPQLNSSRKVITNTKKEPSSNKTDTSNSDNNEGQPQTLTEITEQKRIPEPEVILSNTLKDAHKEEISAEGEGEQIPVKNYSKNVTNVIERKVLDETRN